MVVKIRLNGDEIIEVLESFVKKRYPNLDWRGSEAILSVQGLEDASWGMADLKLELITYPDLKAELITYSDLKVESEK